ncbi:putative ARID DNA-binding domain superfamily [Helianthus anomalus]
MDQVVLQGYTIKITGEGCRIYPMYSPPPLSKIKNENTGLTKEDELGMKEQQRVINHGSKDDEYKLDYLNSYFESLNLSSHEPDWNVMILQAMYFYDFQDFKELLDMLEDVEYVFKYKHELEIKFEEMLEWFIKIKLGISTRPIPPYSAHNRKIELHELYVVKREGGHKNVTSNNLWAVRGRTRSEGCIPEEEGDHYALFTGNDWHEMKNLQKRRRFDFKQAVKAVDEANRSVLMHPLKHNQV